MSLSSVGEDGEILRQPQLSTVTIKCGIVGSASLSGPCHRLWGPVESRQVASIRSPVHLRSGSRLPVNVLPASKRETSAVQPRSGSSPPVRPRRIARLFGMMSCLSPVQPLSGSRLLCQLVGEYRKSLCSAVQPPSGSNPSVHFGCRAFAAPAASARRQRAQQDCVTYL